MTTKTAKTSRFTPFTSWDKIAVGLNLSAAAASAAAGRAWIGLFHLGLVTLLLVLKVKPSDG